jgi:hypothetical protein
MKWGLKRKCLSATLKDLDTYGFGRRPRGQPQKFETNMLHWQK